MGLVKADESLVLGIVFSNKPQVYHYDSCELTAYRPGSALAYVYVTYRLIIIVSDITITTIIFMVLSSIILRALQEFTQFMH